MRYYIITVAAMAAAALVSCGKEEKKDVPAGDGDETAIVEVDVARTATVPHTAEYTANVEAENINNIAPSVANRITSITVDVGDHVSRGQTLVTLDAANADQQLVNLQLTEKNYNRAVELLNIGSGTQSAVDQYKAQLDAQRAQYRNTMQNTVLKAPISGVVTARNYDPGDMTGAQPVLTVGQITPTVKVVININESDISRVRRGMEVGVTLDAFEGEEFSGKITRLAPAVDVATRTFPAEVTLANPQGRILPGMFARVSINLGDAENVVVPDRAIVKQQGSNGKYVYVYRGGKVEFHRVTLGRRIDTGYELLEGIADGDTVVIAGQTRLADGAAARINTRD